jgi:protein phosphatase
MDEQSSSPTVALGVSAPAGRLTLRAAARTHPGRVRDRNEDSVVLISLSGLLAGTPAPSRGPELGFFAVADGMGGHDQGEVASRRVAQQLAAAVLDRVFKRIVLTGRGVDEAWMARALQDCVLVANTELLAAQRASRSDMGTTLTAALVIDGRAVVANVGDSRTYLWRDDTLVQVTRDHSLVASLVAAGALEPEAVYTHEQKAMIYRSVGEADDLTVDTFSLDLRPDDRLLLCSDGLWEMVRDDRLAAVLRAETDPPAVCDRLLDEANRAGGEDNISILVVWVAPAVTP